LFFHDSQVYAFSGKTSSDGDNVFYDEITILDKKGYDNRHMNKLISPKRAMPPNVNKVIEFLFFNVFYLTYVLRHDNIKSIIWALFLYINTFVKGFIS
jgi:hypothetical protein